MKKITVSFLLVLVSTFSNAQTWTKMTIGAGDNFLSVSTPAPSICYLSGSNGVIYKTINGGNTWLSQTSGTTRSLYSIYFTNTTNGYAVGDNKTAIYTTDGGTTWSPLNLIPASPVFHFRHIKFIDDSTGFASGGAYPLGGTVADSGVVYKTSDAGATWSIALVTGLYGSIYSTFFTSSQVGYAAEYSGPMHKTTDGGLTWNSYAAGDSLNPSMVCFVDENKGFLNCQSDGKRKYTTDAGLTWNAFTDLSPEMVFGMDFYDSKNGFSVGGNVANNTGLILQTTDAGVTWNPVLLDSASSRLIQVDFNTEQGFFAGLNGNVFKYLIPPIPADTTFKCKHWSKLTSGTTNNLLSVTAPSSTVTYTSGNNGTILKTIDRGETWIPQTSRTTEHINSICFTTIDTGYAVGENKVALQTTNGGATWTPMTLSLNTTANYNLKHIQFINKNIGYACGSLMTGTPAIADSGFVCKTINGGSTWTISLKTTNKYGGVNSTFFTSLLVGYASELEGPVYKTTDGGGTWTSVNASNNNSSGVIHFTDAQNGVFTTNTGQIKKTKNAGLSYSTVKDSIIPGMLKGIDFYDTLNGFSVTGDASGNSGAIMQTTNSGDSWFKLNINMSFPKLINIDVYDKDLGYMVGHDGLIIKYDTCPNNDTIIIWSILENDYADNKLNVYPNPIGAFATVDLSNVGFVGKLTIEMMDVFGKIIKKEIIFNSDKYIINRVDLPSGIYFIKAYDTNGHVAIGKFIAN